MATQVPPRQSMWIIFLALPNELIFDIIELLQPHELQHIRQVGPTLMKLVDSRMRHGLASLTANALMKIGKYLDTGDFKHLARASSQFWPVLIE